ncbi:UNVERIFIED_CONTAM: hypothetical protein Sindi_2859800 [Sesamum indicum]
MSESSRYEQEGRWHLTDRAKQRMIGIASKNVMDEHYPFVGEPSRRRRTEERRKGIVGGQVEGTVRVRKNKEVTPATSWVRGRSVTASSNNKAGQPAISGAEMEDVRRQIEKLKQQLDDLKKRSDLKKRGDPARRNLNSPFINEILSEVVGPNFQLPDLPKYDGLKDPREHITTFEMVMNLYRQTDSINAKLFVTTLTGKAQEWFTSLPNGTIGSYEQLIHRFAYHFASKQKSKRSAAHLFAIWQGSDESLKDFMGRFNNETLEVQDLRIDMMTSILVHGLKKGPFASALARDPPGDVEQLMLLAHKYINEEEMNAIKDREWEGDRDRSQDRRR